ncbi:hypothetical protein [Priestia koreensis]
MKKKSILYKSADNAHVSGKDVVLKMGVTHLKSWRRHCPYFR